MSQETLLLAVLTFLTPLPSFIAGMVKQCTNTRKLFNVGEDRQKNREKRTLILRKD
jgi:hypothetical protein